MPPTPIINIPDDEDYASSEDSDFAPEEAPKRESSDSSDSEAETNDGVKKTQKKSRAKPVKRKRNEEDNEADVGFENSGDEGLIREGKKALKRRRKKGEESDDDGDGGLVKTRSQRALEYVIHLPIYGRKLTISRKVEKKPLANVDTATVDVDAVWASMISGNLPKPTAQGKASNTLSISAPKPDVLKTHNRPSATEDSMITIKRTYNFAGKVHVEEKTIQRDSAEARLWLVSRSGDDDQLKINTVQPTKPKRPTKKLRRSMFEPILESIFPPRTDLHFGANRAAGEELMKEALNAKKLNTVEKSKMDWAGFVDKEGIKNELEVAGKAKGSYIERQNFLSRVEVTRDEEARKARTAK